MTDDLFTGTRGPHNARVMIVGESYGREEARKGIPFCGTAGGLLEDLLADVALPGIDRHPETEQLRDSVFITNIVNEQPRGNNMWEFFHPTTQAKKEGRLSTRGLYPHDNVLRGLDKLYAQIEAVQPELIIGFGNYTLWALTEDFFGIGNSSRPRGWQGNYPTRKVPTGIVSRRGSQLCTETTSQRIPFLPTIHPAAFARAWYMRHWVVHDLAARAPLAFRHGRNRSATLRWNPPDWNFIVRPDYDTVINTLDNLLAKACVGQLRIASDLETKPGRFITCVGLAWSKTDAICIPFIHNVNQNYWTPEEEQQIWRRLCRIHTHPNIQIIGQNYLYDTQYIWQEWGIQVTPYMDTMIAQHVLWPGELKGLHFLASMYADYYRYWKDEGKELDTKDDVEGWTYNCKDCVYTWEISYTLEDLLHSVNLTPQYLERMQQFPMAFEMMDYGVPIDHKVRNEIRTELMLAIEAHEQKLIACMPDAAIPPTKSKNAAPWYRSDPQLMTIIYDVLGLKPVIKPSTGSRTLDKDAIPVLCTKYPEMILLLHTIEELRSMNNSYNAAGAKLDPDGRLRTSINLAGPETMRWATSENAYGRGKNLQNITTGNELEEDE